MINPLASPQARNNLFFFSTALRRNEKRDRLADGFVRGVAENPLRTLVPTGDDAVEALADNRVIGGVHYGGQQRVCPLRLLARRDLYWHVDAADDLSRRIAQ